MEATRTSVNVIGDDDVRRLLDLIGVLRQPCDLDLLLFFVRHPRALLTSDQIAALLGYDVNQLADSLDILMTARMVTRMQKTTGAARMYVFAGAESSVEWLPRLVELTSSREGRVALRDALKGKGRSDGDTPGPSRASAIG
jgi:hypothetical protein